MNLRYSLCTLALMTALSQTGHSQVIDHTNSQAVAAAIKTLGANQSIDIPLANNQYVDSMLIVTEGRGASRSGYNFAHVYADGDLVAKLGIPNEDPEYPVIVRGNVSKITIVVQPNSRIEIKNIKIMTQTEQPSYTIRKSKPNFNPNNMEWGASVLSVLHEINMILYRKYPYDLSNILLSNLKRAARDITAAERVREAPSMETKARAKRLVAEIEKVKPLLENGIYLNDNDFTPAVLELLTIQEDIRERYGMTSAQ